MYHFNCESSIRLWALNQHQLHHSSNSNPMFKQVGVTSKFRRQIPLEDIRTAFCDLLPERSWHHFSLARRAMMATEASWDHLWVWHMEHWLINVLSIYHLMVHGDLLSEIVLIDHSCLYWPVTWVIPMKWVLNIISKRSNIIVEIFVRPTSLDVHWLQPTLLQQLLFFSLRSLWCQKHPPRTRLMVRSNASLVALPGKTMWYIRYLWACQQQDYHCHIFFLWAMPQNQIKSYMRCSVIFHVYI